MKIAILSFYNGHIQRGVENWTCEIANRLSRKYKVIVFQNGPANKGVNYEIVSTNLRVNWKAKDSRGTFLRKFFLDYWSGLIAKSTLKVLSTLFKKNFDIIIPTNGGWQVAIMRLFSWIRGSKLVVVGHSGPGWDDRNNLWNFPDIFVALSKRAQKWAKSANPFIKTVVIPDGINLDCFTSFGPKVKINLSPPLVLAVGAPEAGKRFELAIRAIAQLKKGGLLILGGGYDEKKIKTLGKRLLKNRFLMKLVPFDKIPLYYRAADLFTLPSWENEAFGMVYLEAMASNLPVVATDDELRREIVGNAGILVDPTDINAYAKAIDKALKTNWGDKPRKQAEKFSWDKVVEDYEKLFKDLVKK
jgi:glycosyltransferase involved in cell wall biosynthesis